MPPPHFMEQLLLTSAQPFLIGIGLLIVANAWNIVQTLLSNSRSKERKTSEEIEKLKELVIKLTVDVEGLKRDLNNVGQILRDMRGKG